MAAVCHEEAHSSGRRHVTVSVCEFIFIAKETENGKIISDETKDTYYHVHGLRERPGQLVFGAVISLLVKIRLTALLSRGVLVFNGRFFGPIKPETGKVDSDVRVKWDGSIATGRYVYITRFPNTTTITTIPTPTLQTSTTCARCR